MVALVVELAGFALTVVAAFMVSTVVGLVVLGVGMLAYGVFMDRS